MARTLLIIDIQRDYFPGGAYPLVDPEAAAINAAQLLAAFRDAGEPVIHMQHVWDAPDAPFMRAGTPGMEIHELVAPVDGEPVLQKTEPNSFLGTDLEDELRRNAPDELVVAGMMSSMCVDATVRAAAEKGFAVVVAHDACAAPELQFDGREIAGRDVHGAFMAALGDGYAQLRATAELA
jgi:nicotinamidase-related amidase